MSNELATLADNPNLEEALLQDGDGSFRAGVDAYLASWKEKVEESLAKGLTREEFEQLSRLKEGIETTERVINFLVKTQPPAAA